MLTYGHIADQEKKSTSPTQRDDMTLNPVTLPLTICGPQTGRVPVLDSPCVVGVFHSHAVGLRGAPYQTQQPGLMARNHSPCTVLSAHTRQTTACSVSTRIAQRRVELAAARPLPSPESPAVHKDSPCIPRESHALRPQALYMRWHPTPVLGHTNRDLSCTEIPPRTMCGSGLSPGPAERAHRPHRRSRCAPARQGKDGFLLRRWSHPQRSL